MGGASGSLGWHVRPYAPGDEEGIVRLWETVFGRPLTVDHWRWKLKTRPAPAENVWVATDDVGRVIAHYAAIPATFKLGDALVDTSVVVDVMTDPNFRRQRVLAAVTSAAHAAWIAAGVGLVLGLPNEKAQARLPSWQLRFDLPWSRRLLRVDEILTRRGRLGRVLAPAATTTGRLLAKGDRRPLMESVDGIRVAAVERDTFDWSAADGLWRSASLSYENLQVRDGAWWRWRFLDAPSANYRVMAAHRDGELRGLVALHFRADASGRRGTICELFSTQADPGAATALLDRALVELWELGVGTVLTLAPVGSFAERVERRLGFRRRPVAFQVMNMPIDETSSQLFSDDPERWHLSGADFDVV